MLTKQKGETSPQREQQEQTRSLFGWVNRLHGWGQMEGEEGGRGGRKAGRSRPDATLFLCRAVEQWLAAESPRRIERAQNPLEGC